MERGYLKLPPFFCVAFYPVRACRWASPRHGHGRCPRGYAPGISSNSAKAPIIESTKAANGAAGVEVGLPGGLKALASSVQALHVGEHSEDGAPASVYFGDDEDVPGCRVVVPDLAPGDPASEVRGGSLVNVLAGDGPAARGGVLSEDAELRLGVLISVHCGDAGVQGGSHWDNLSCLVAVTGAPLV